MVLKFTTDSVNIVYLYGARINSNKQKRNKIFVIKNRHNLNFFFIYVNSVCIIDVNLDKFLLFLLKTSCAICSFL